jgi:hypothetical protein
LFQIIVSRVLPGVVCRISTAAGCRLGQPAGLPVSLHLDTLADAVVFLMKTRYAPIAAHAWLIAGVVGFYWALRLCWIKASWKPHMF